MEEIVPLPHAAAEVLVTWPDYDPEHPDLGGALRRAGLELRLAPKRGARSTAELRELVAGAVAAIVSTDPFDASVLAGAPALRVIARVGVGLDSIDLEAASAHGVAVAITPGANEETVADHTVALMLAALRRIPEHDAGVRRGEWNRTGAHTPWLLSGATVGLVGYGRIGQRVADRLRGFGVRMLASDPAAASAAGVTAVPLAQLLREAHVVSLHCPLSPATRGLIGRAELAAMRPDAVLVNTARGGIVDEQALVEALEQGRLRAAALDVFADEPPRDARLLALSNALFSPHVAGLSEASVETMTRQATAAVLDVLAGRPSQAVVNAAALASPVPAGSDA